MDGMANTRYVSLVYWSVWYLGSLWLGDRLVGWGRAVRFALLCFALLAYLLFFAANSCLIFFFLGGGLVHSFLSYYGIVDVKRYFRVGNWYRRSAG